MSRPLAALRLIKKEEDIDLFVDCDSWPRINAMLAALSCARHIIGFKTPGMLRHFAFDRYAEHSKDIHEMENYRRLFCLAGFSCKEDPKVIPQCSAHPLPENKFTVIHMFPGGTGAKLKSWPDENWISVINYLTEQKMEVYLTGSPSDLPAVQKIKAACSILDKIFIAAGNYSLSDTACLLQKSEAVISVNTGIMHLAAAVGAKIIALHGPTAVKRWGPVSSGAINVTADFHCSPCLNLGFEYKCRDGGCMQTINAEMIINILKESII
ncbi:MAG TPA: hypothetical protein DC049_04395 [Spirochaetia bacterium]|nr:hypothetical protein [Spirochaetia bacterium]